MGRCFEELWWQIPDVAAKMVRNARWGRWPLLLASPS